MNALMMTLYFIISIVFNLFIYTLWIRIGLRYLRFSSLHPVSQLIFTLTNPLVRPLQSIVQKNAKSTQLEWGSIILLLLVELFKFILLGLLFYGQLFPLSYLLVFILADLVIQPLNLLFYMILIRVIMSWVQPDWRHPVNELISVFTNPILRLGHHFIPPISGFDFAPLIVLFIIKAITLFISASLPIHIL
ncbi:MAG: YggT family protein [Legionellaceae bacterium]|nr:YggT family protein [Legionellaceae bacterium]